MNETEFITRRDNLLKELQLIQEDIKELPGYSELKAVEDELRKELETLRKTREYSIKEEECNKRLQLLSPYGELRQVDSFYMFVLNGCPSISHIEYNPTWPINIQVFPEEVRKYILGTITRDKHYCLEDALDAYLQSDNF
jgi:hypothetical protein